MKRKETKKIVTISLLACLIVVLQVVATFIRFGSFPITLTLIPIIISGAIYDEKVSALMGLIFGFIVVLMVVLGLDASGASMMAIHPVITITACLLKGVLAGLTSGLVYKWINKKNQKVAIVVSALTAPIVNTVTLYLVLIIFFETSFAALVTALMSANFIIEVVINLVMAPSLLGIINHFSKRHNN